MTSCQYANTKCAKIDFDHLCYLHNHVNVSYIIANPCRDSFWYVFNISDPYTFQYLQYTAPVDQQFRDTTAKRADDYCQENKTQCGITSKRRK